MEAQEIFDTVAKHLATQGRKSTLRDSCRYHGPDGLKCAVGVFVPDDFDTSGLEGDDALGLLGKCGAEPWCLPLLPHGRLLDELQSAHDDPTTGADVLGALRGIAHRNHLSIDTLDTLTFPEVWA
jgi:hypothetical protein